MPMNTLQTRIAVMRRARRSARPLQAVDDEKGAGEAIGHRDHQPSADWPGAAARRSPAARKRSAAGLRRSSRPSSNSCASGVVQARSVFVSRTRVDSPGQYLGCALLAWGCGRVRHAEQSGAKGVGEVVDDSDDAADGDGDRHPRDDLPEGPRLFHRIRCPRSPCHRFFLKDHDCSSPRRR